LAPAALSRKAGAAATYVGAVNDTRSFAVDGFGTRRTGRFSEAVESIIDDAPGRLELYSDRIMRRYPI